MSKSVLSVKTTFVLTASNLREDTTILSGVDHVWCSGCVNCFVSMGFGTELLILDSSFWMMGLSPLRMHIIQQTGETRTIIC